MPLLFLGLLLSCTDNNDPDPEPGNEFGTLLWTYEDFNVNPEPTEPVRVTEPAVGPDGTIYVSSYDGVGTWHNARVHAIHPDGSFKWATQELESISVTAPAIGKHGNVYVISHYTIYAINPSDGSFSWTWEVPDDLHYQISYLTLGNDGMIFCATVGAGSYHRQIFAINSDGQKVWQREVTSKIYGLSVGIDGTLFAYWNPNGNGHIFALDPADGSVIWSKDIEGYVNADNSLAVAPDSGLIISQSGPEKLLKLDANDGEILWQKDAPNGFPSISSDGNIYLLAGKLYAFNREGSPKWEVETGATTSAKRLSIDAEGKIYGGMYDGLFNGNFEVYYPNGTLKWAFPEKMNYSAAIGENKVMYFVYKEGESAVLYAVQGDQPIAGAGWPRRSGGNRNSRNAGIR
ncbi:MAG: PQQ-binding-like beta-propeller repeat protein [Bacteroidales bacterium]|nr:PQQ-binding-like beta-propeller repeat protein [Bacteroidales bacterium]MCF8343191.1 PQQ-binding-like beta-propeller repeat protein [Bacteroidales bacterium]MCF8377274.1 PQQ-binding-like beta-propeller repeat protein [Bacteroidales bacterium]MCF8401104.1 PQQ-binding-like beta-propeller repeat protein [Bacteroidales bacterium]